MGRSRIWDFLCICDQVLQRRDKAVAISTNSHPSAHLTLMKKSHLLSVTLRSHFISINGCEDIDGDDSLLAYSLTVLDPNGKCPAIS